MDELAHNVYRVTKNFPKQELYGLVSQITRAAISVVLNYIEGYARRKPAVRLNFLEISFGSLKETQYLLHFTYIEKFLSEEDYKKLSAIADQVAAMLYTEVDNLSKSLD
mgnify:CR=1 FL=1